MLLIIKFYNETINLTHNPTQNSILNLKNSIELSLGLPIELQRLSFIDDLDLPNEKSLKFFGISHKSKLNLKIKSEIDFKKIFLAARKGGLEAVSILKEQDILRNAIAVPKCVNKPSQNLEEFSPLNRHVLAVERVKIIRKSWQVGVDDKSQEKQNLQNLEVPKLIFDDNSSQIALPLSPRIDNDRPISNTNYLRLSMHAFKKQRLKENRNLSLRSLTEPNMTLMSSLVDESEIPETVKEPPKIFDIVKKYKNKNKKSLKNWENYRIYITMLAAIGNNNVNLLRQIYEENPKVFLNSKSKISKRSVLHFACANLAKHDVVMHGQTRMSNNCLLTMLYKFNDIDLILHDKDYQNLTPAKLAKKVGKNSNGQILLRYDWELRTNSRHLNTLCSF
jgi:hypothetical protein